MEGKEDTKQCMVEEVYDPEEIVEENPKLCITAKEYGDDFWPSYGTEGSCGLDIRIPTDVEIPPQNHLVIWTPVSVELPRGYFGMVKSRSSILRQNCLIDGIIDSDYRGNIHIIAFNLNKDKTLKFQKGTAIAQMIVAKYYQGIWLCTRNQEDLRKTERGACGFGSTSSSINQND